MNTWLDLWTRCRISIETVERLDTRGLSPAKVPAAFFDPEKVGADAARAWKGESSRLLAVEMERRRRNGNARRSCDVVLAQGAEPLSKDEKYAISLAFLEHRGMLIAEGGHEVRDPYPLYPWYSVGVGPVKQNPNDCTVISSIVIDPTSDFFSSGSGEQNKPGCEGPPLLPRDEAPERPGSK